MEVITRIEPAVLKVLWQGLTQMFENYEDGAGLEALVEARRLVAIEMREQGYEQLWRDLTEQ